MDTGRRQTHRTVARREMLLGSALLAAGGITAVTAAALPRPGRGSVADPPDAPALAPGVWVNGKPTTLAAQRGRVVVLAFWTHLCINCKRTLPFWNGWAARYARSGDVAVLAVHTPELEPERDPEAVRRYAREAGLRFPVVTDNEFKTWKAFGVTAWPTTVVIDKQGRIRGRWVGELDWQGSGEYHKAERLIEELRREKGADKG